MSRPEREPSPASDRESLLERVHIMEGIHRALTRWTEVSVMAYEADNSASLVEELKTLLDVDEVQANAIIDTQVRRVNRFERERVAQTLEELRDELGS